MESLPSDPPQPYKPRHTNAQRAILGLNIVVVLACLIGAGAIIYGKQQLDQRLQTGAIALETTVAPQPSTTSGTGAATNSTGVPATFPSADPQAKNFLIVGSDANACVDADSPWAGAADPLRENIGNRSDTIMVMRVDPATRTAAVLSFPRDLWVPIPGKSKGRINSAYIKNDPSLLSQTIFENFGIAVDHYIQVDFCAFKRIVDAVGGVAVPFSTPILDKNVNINIPNAGCHTFGGDEALAYVRSRHLKWVDSNGKAHEDTGYDLARISRQQDFLRRTLRAALDKGIFDPAVARALIVSLQTDIVTEQGFTVNDMLEFAGVLKDIDPAGIRTYQIEASRLIVSGNDVLEPKIKGDNMKSILAIFRGEAPLAGAPEQAFESTTTSSTTSTTIRPIPGATTTPTSTGPATTVPAVTTTATTVPAVTTTTASGAAENPKGDIVPDPNVTCS